MAYSEDSRLPHTSVHDTSSLGQPDNTIAGVGKIFQSNVASPTGLEYIYTLVGSARKAA